MNTPRIDQIKEFLLESPDDSFLLFALAKEYEKNENFKVALEVYLQLRKVDAEYVGTYYHLGKLYEELDELQNAMNIYDEGIKVANGQKDWHSLSELNNARTNLEMEL